MTKWLLSVWCILVCLSVENVANRADFLLPGKNVLNIIPEFLGQTPQASTTVTSSMSSSSVPSDINPASGFSEMETSFESSSTFMPDVPDPPDPRYPVLHAGLPQSFMVDPLPLPDSDHELMFNVSWVPSTGPPARDYSIEVLSLTNTEDCRSPICYEYDISGDSQWHIVPSLKNHVVETCAIRPGCAYSVRLIAHPWDGHSSLNLHVQLDECVSGVCSCAHAPRLPVPVVRASSLSIEGEIYANVSWVLHPPRYPQRLPRGLKKHSYYVSIGKQMVSDAHPSPWFASSIWRQVDTEGLVALGDEPRWLLVRIAERSADRKSERSGEKGTSRSIMLDVKILARVNLVDDRACIGPAGNATAYDPSEAKKLQLGTYALWAVFGGACVLAMVAVVAVSARGVKRVLRALRPPPVSAPLEPLRLRPAWFPLQLSY